MDAGSRRQVAAGVDKGARVNVAGVGLQLGEGADRGGGDGRDARERFQQHGFALGTHVAHREPGKQQRALSRNEHPWSHRQPQRPELHRAEQMLERLTALTPRDQPLAAPRVGCGPHQRGGLVLGEHAAGCPQPPGQRVQLRARSGRRRHERG